MASITTWTRLEPRTRSDDLTPSLEARVHDPAWLLGRQWQIGEFVGEDVGSPVSVSLEVETSPISDCRLGDSSRAAITPGLPLDCLAGAEIRGKPSMVERAEAGAELWELLMEAGCSLAGGALLVGANLLPLADARAATDEGAALLTLAAGRLPDGEALAPVVEAIALSGQVPDEFGLAATDKDPVIRAAKDWMAWRATIVYRNAAATWVDERLEHRFELAVRPTQSSAFTLSAPEWNGDRLDWYDLDVDLRLSPPNVPADAPDPLPLPGVTNASGTVKASGLPTPLSYAGMPASRWWQFEDANVNFAKVTAAPEDLARMLLVEFASVYSNDWYLWPLELPVGAVHTIKKLEVVNTFGETILVGAMEASAGDSTTNDWQAFCPTKHGLTGAPGIYDGLVLLPALASPLEGETLEEIRFLRDEMANLAWAVEATAQGEDGLPLDRQSHAAATGGLPCSRPEHPVGDADPLRYRFATEVPVHWFPLVPDPNGAAKFRRLVLRRVDENGEVQDVLPRGELLSPTNQWLWQEEVPRDGARVVRRYRLARGGDGALYAWSARRAERGKGEGSSGLRYDEVIPMPRAPKP